MLDEKKALKLKRPKAILRAAKEAEHSNCEQHIIRQLYKNYYAASEKAELKRLRGRGYIQWKRSKSAKCIQEK